MRKSAGAGARRKIAAVIAGLLVSGSALAATPPTPAPAAPAQTNRGAVTFDVLVVRPLSLAVVPIGIAAFLPTALLSAAGGKDNFEAALELFVTEPVNYVFKRPLGEF